MLANGKPDKAISSLVKLHAAVANRPVSLDEALSNLDSEDDSLLGNVSELLMTHPLAIKRINEIKQYAASADYQRLRQYMSANIFQ
jgi:Zn-dependent protease with chaperone function